MKILCCYTNDKLSLEALRSFASYAKTVKMVNCTGDWTSRGTMVESMTAYWRAFRGNWTGKDDLLLLKQRLSCKDDTLSALDDCPGVLCVQDGHTRYRKELQQAIPRQDIAGDYMVWHLLEVRLKKLWEIHQIPICNHQE